MKTLRSSTEALTRAEANDLYRKVLADNDAATMRELCLTDLFYLLTVALKRRDADNDWCFARCREVQADPNGYLDVWSREFYKSTIITFALTVQDILRNPEITIGFFSFVKPIAKAFLRQIKAEFEQNEFLKLLFHDVLYENPKRDSPRWSEDNGVIVKRKTNPKEATIEAWGLTDGQPTSKHYMLMVYDDIVTEDSVRTENGLATVTKYWRLSLNLGSRGGVKRYVGTFYHFNDTYRTMIDQGSVKVRKYPGREGGKIDGKPVYLTERELLEKRRDMGPYVFSCQILLNPVADAVMGFKEEWLHFREFEPQRSWNYYLITDPAGEKKKTNDFTVMVVIAAAPDRNYYLVDGIRDRMNLTQRTTALLTFHQRWNPTVVGYEKYGKDSDIEHIKYEQDLANYRFEIVPLGGQMPKNDRIRQMVPVFEQHRFIMPYRLLFATAEGKTNCFVKEFIGNEYLAFPVGTHDDMLDTIARIKDPDMRVTFPLAAQARKALPVASRTNSEYNPLG